MEAKRDLDVLAFFLPQFHPIPENDEWWGKGFTEWSKVAVAKKAYPGHYQPHVPRDLGFYDLRVPEVREAQAALARQFGVTGFIYYHYWFNGRRLLERPVNDMLATGKPDLPFCLAWANENWTRRWDGGESDLLVGQKYSPVDDLEHFASLLPTFRDERYITRDGRPVFAIYRPSLLPDVRSTTERWRSAAEDAGLPGLYLVSIESFRIEANDPRVRGFDAAFQFQPTNWDLPLWGAGLQTLERAAYGSRLLRHRVRSYSRLVQRELAAPDPDYPRWPGVTPMWDNSARRKRGGIILHGSSPELYAEWVSGAAAQARRIGAKFGESPLLVVNAWNEWAEGNHLEPDQKNGSAYLEAQAAALRSTPLP